MTKLKRKYQSSHDETSIRLHAAWLYHGQGLTQNDVATKLGLSRSTVIKLLEDAKTRGEVRVWIEEGESKLLELALQLERKFSIDEVIVVPACNNQQQAMTSRKQVHQTIKSPEWHKRFSKVQARIRQCPDRSMSPD